MSRMVTLATMQTRALQRAAMQFASATAAIAGNSTSQPQGELVDNINEGLAKLYDLVSSVEGQPYYLQSLSFSTNVSTDTYPIGPGQTIGISDFYRFRGLDVNFGQNIVITAKPFMWKERNRYKWLGGWVYTQPVFYRLIGNSLQLIPSPGGAFSCKLWYTPTPPVLVNSTDQFDGINGFEEFAILDAAIKLLVRQERIEHAQLLMQMQEVEKQRILAMAGARDAEDPERVQDVTLNDGWIGAPGY